MPAYSQRPIGPSPTGHIIRANEHLIDIVNAKIGMVKYGVARGAALVVVQEHDVVMVNCPVTAQIDAEAHLILRKAETQSLLQKAIAFDVILNRKHDMRDRLGTRL